jgi:prepilin signal peptidase PulO-like enzyme (type II secretory pathway)
VFRFVQAERRTLKRELRTRLGLSGGLDDNLTMDPTVALIYYAVFIFVLGLCVGSFLNVVIWRLPHSGQMVSYGGQTRKLSLAWPASHCPNCDTPVRWYQNVPVFSWIFLRAKCARCKVPIPIRYPLVELATGGMFLAFYLAYFVGGWQPGFVDPQRDWPALALHLFMIASLLAASAIDADWFIIPLEIPWVMAAVALVAGPFIDQPVIPRIDYGGDIRLQMLAKGVLGGAVGLILANVLLWLKVLKPSFPPLQAEPTTAPANDDQIEPLPSVKNTWPLIATTLALIIAAVACWIAGPRDVASLVTVCVAIAIFLLGVLPRDASSVDVTEDVENEINAPGARKAMLREILFLLFPLVGFSVAAVLPMNLPAEPHLERFVGILLGLLAGGGLVWVVRIAGTLFFGREAMGPGDVHLMAGIGAVIGAPLVVAAFFIAPFLGLTWAFVRLIMRKSNVLPYGPWLSLASILSLLIAEPIAKWYAGHFLHE